MAQTRRPNNPADIYAAHAEEARGHRAAALADRYDEAVTHFDHAAAHHDTAARMLRNAEKIAGRGAAYRQSAALARGRRRESMAAQYDELAAAQEAAAAHAPLRAGHFHALGLERSANGHTVRAARALAAENTPGASVAAAAVTAPSGPHWGSEADPA